MQFYFDNEYDWKGQIIEQKENQSISYLLVKADEDWQDTSLHFELQKDGKYSRVRFEHKGRKAQIVIYFLLKISFFSNLHMLNNLKPIAN